MSLRIPSLLPNSPSRRQPNHSRLSSSESTLHSPTIPLLAPQTPRRRQASHLQPSLAMIPTPLSSLAPLCPSNDSRDGMGKIYISDDTSVSGQWLIEDVKRLMEHIEGHTPDPWTAEHEMNDPEGLPQALQRGVIIGEGSYKLDIARSSPRPISSQEPSEEETDVSLNPPSRTPGSVSLYIATLILPAHQNYQYPTNVFIGIRPIHSNDGQRYATPNWIWTHDMDFTFSYDTDFCEVQLPKLSDLVRIEAIDRADGFMLSVEIKSSPGLGNGIGRPNQVVVPQSILRGLKGLVDSSTGDVRFVCLEHTNVPGRESVEESGEIVSRKRVLYAHSDVLKARGGDYFEALLAGGFIESESKRVDNRYITVLVDDAGFETVYWLLRFIYTNELQFSANNDVRALTKQSNFDKSLIANLLNGTPHYDSGAHGEWDYRSLSTESEMADEDVDVRTSKNGVNATTAPDKRASISRDIPAAPTLATQSRTLGIPSSDGVSSPSTEPSKRSVSVCSPTKSPTKLSAKPSVSTAPQASVGSTHHTPSRPPSSGKIPVESGSNPGTTSRSLYNPNAVRNHAETDPHAHPTVEPPPAQSLSVFILAHRYRLEDLERLARDNILGNLTPDNCIMMLLATYRYDALHAEIMDYAVTEWCDIQSDPEFFRNIQEFTSGQWGEVGASVLHDLLRRV